MQIDNDKSLGQIKTILVVDDERPICDLLADLLADEGYEVGRAYDGLSALATLEHRQPDLVLSDVMMPGLDGVSLIQRLRERGIQSPVILMSAVYADVDLPHVRFIPKPFDVDDVLVTVKRLLPAPNGNTPDNGHARRRRSHLRVHGHHRRGRPRLQPV